MSALRQQTTHQRIALWAPSPGATTPTHGLRASRDTRHLMPGRHPYLIPIRTANPPRKHKRDPRCNILSRWIIRRMTVALEGISARTSSY
jgi:hypothetical protein